MMLLGGILIGNTVDYILSLRKEKLLKGIVFISCYLYLIFLISPALMNKMNFNLSLNKDNMDYQIIYEHLKKR